MEKNDYDALKRHSATLNDAIDSLKKIQQFETIVELEKEKSVIQQLQDAKEETDTILAKIDEECRKASIFRHRVDFIIKVLPIPTIVLVGLFAILKNGSGVLLVAYFAILLLLLLVLFKKMSIGIKEITVTIAVGVAFVCALHFSKWFQGFVRNNAAEIGAVSLVYALILPLFSK
jgi:hypothetical protein